MAPVTWKVVGQAPTRQPTPQGTFESGVTVTFQTGSGVTSSVFVPDSVYTADNVRAMIAQKAAAIEAVQSLSSEG